MNKKQPGPTNKKHILFFVSSILFFSGFAALSYEIIWIRMLSLTFGVTSYAMAIVVSIFMAGLGVGNLLLGRLADRHPSLLLHIVLICQLVIGAFALASLKMNSLIASLYPLMSDGSAMDTPRNLFVRGALALGMLIIPTISMGASMPIMVKLLKSSGIDVGYSAAILYGADTLGGAAGCLLPAFFLIPRFGFTPTLYCAVGANEIAAFLATIMMSKKYLFDRNSTARRIEQQTPSEIEIFSDTQTSKRGTLAPLILAFSGLAVMGYELLWTRIVSVLLVTTVYAYSIILAAFLVGLSLGGFLYARLPHKWLGKKIASTLCVVQVMLGATAVFVTLIMPELHLFVVFLRTQLGLFWGVYHLLICLLFIFVFAISIVLAGISFPIALRLYRGPESRVGESTGVLLIANTTGNIIGALVAGFVLVPMMGINHSIYLLALFNLLAALLSLITGKKFSGAYHKPGLLSVLALLILLVSVSSMDSEGTLKRIHEQRIPKNRTIVHYREGAVATIAVTADKQGNMDRLWIDGNNAAAVYYGALQTEKAQGHLAFALHPNPEQVCLICFGTGATLGSLLCDPRVKAVDMVELSPEVLAAAHFFNKFNYNALQDNRVSIVQGDGRNHLAVTDHTYDIITFEPMHPGLRGSITLYTYEFYQLCKSRLKKGGIISQWIPLYQLSTDDVKSLVATFYRVFPHGAVWLNYEDIILLGSNEPLTMDISRTAQLMEIPAVKDDAQFVALDDVAEFAASFCLTAEQAREYSQNHGIIMDDFPFVEYTAPRSLILDTAMKNVRRIIAFRASFPFTSFYRNYHGVPLRSAYQSLSLTYQGLVVLRAGHRYLAWKLFEQAKSFYPQNKRLTAILQR